MGYSKTATTYSTSVIARYMMSDREGAFSLCDHRLCLLQITRKENLL